MPWQKNGTPETLTGIGDTLTISDLTPLKFNMFLAHAIQVDATALRPDVRLDNLSTSIYATRYNQDGTAGDPSPLVNQTRIVINPSGKQGDFFFIAHGINIDSQEKLLMTWVVSRNSTGSANAPIRAEAVHKSTQSAQYTEFDLFDPAVDNDWDTDSNLSAIGSD